MPLEKIFPQKYKALGHSIGIKKKSGLLDFGVIHSEIPASAGAVFTRNRFPGNPVIVGQEHIRNGRLQTIIVNSGNANVATGPEGLELVKKYCQIAADNLGIEPELILPSSTGVIGQKLSYEKMCSACGKLSSDLVTPDFDAFAQAIMTTDAFPKMNSSRLSSGITLTGIAKGAGMIQPDMATMLAYLVCDAKIESSDLQRLTVAIADRTFNRLSVDSDTSTSDTFVIMANGASGQQVSFSEKSALAYRQLVSPFEPGALESLPDLDSASLEFVRAVSESSLELGKLIVKDGEGAEKLIELQIAEAQSSEQALKIGRSIINSPLFKTAIHGADPNWGRIVMAIGKVFDEDIPYQGLRLFFGEHELAPDGSGDNRVISEYLRQPEVKVKVVLGTGQACETLWGCDLTAKYIEINSYYTT